MIEIDNKSKCSGCGTCSLICPQKCISMREDKEGFLYPVVDTSKCIRCNICVNRCPIVTPNHETVIPQKGYLLQNLDENVRYESTSGGAFTAIASLIIDRKGVVFGAAYDDDFNVYHTYVEDYDGLKRFRNSKYVQSDLGESFKLVKRFLQMDRWVCFSGTPCQVEGLKRYLTGEHNKLVLIDVVCHGVPSPLIWRKYLEYMRIYEVKPSSIRFRDKYYGYKYSTMSIIRNGKTIYHAGSQKDPMMRAFFSEICSRPICYVCPFRGRYRVSDVTIWDCFNVRRYNKTMDDDKGTTRVLSHSPKGMELIDECVKYARVVEIDPDDLTFDVKEMVQSPSINPLRNDFFRDAQLKNGRELFDKYYPVDFVVWIKTIIRKLLVTFGLYKLVKGLLCQ